MYSWEKKTKQTAAPAVYLHPIKETNFRKKDAITFLCKAEQLIEKMVSRKASRHGLTQKKILSEDIKFNKEGRESRHALTSSLGTGVQINKNTHPWIRYSRHTDTHTLGQLCPETMQPL